MVPVVRKRRRLVVAWSLCMVGACGAPEPGTLEIATTTSVQNSGLLDHMLPAFEREAGLRIHVHAAGSGRALQMLANRSVDAVISHAPEAERRLLSQHAAWSYRKIAYNWFVVVGPASDPADVRGVSNAVDAFRRIADSGAAFISRGDASGTHERENALWQAAGRRPRAERLVVSGRSMAQALRHADEAQAYTLTDAPTFWQLRGGLELETLFEGDPRLLNSYAVIHRSDQPDASAFATWLSSDSGRARLTSFSIEGRRAYQPWPLGCASARSDDAPCLAPNSKR